MLIPHFIDWDINQPSPYFTPFKNISWIEMQYTFYDHWLKNLEIIDKALINVDKLNFRDNILSMLWEFNRDRLKRLKVNEVRLSFPSISDFEIEALNEIKFRTLNLDEIDYSFDAVQLLTQFNSTDITMKFKSNFSVIFKIMILNSSILLLQYEHILLDGWTLGADRWTLALEGRLPYLKGWTSYLTDGYPIFMICLFV